jgi:hypothetical protein
MYKGAPIDEGHIFYLLTIRRNDESPIPVISKELRSGD